jgi:uroporphyrin-3 C-methyltransferase
MLREEIRLNIQEAQWALLHRNEAVYQWSLSQALQHIHGTFEASASTTTSLIRQLQHLQQMNLALKKPMVGHSLPLLNEWIESKNVPTPKLDGDHSS